MKRARIIVLAIALLAAGAAALIAKSLIGAKPEIKEVVKTDYKTVEVLVANLDIGLGESIQSKDLRWQAWPSDAVTSGYIVKRKRRSAKSELSGSLARAPFLAGEPIKEKKLIKANEGGVMAAILPAGMRAISTQIAPESAVGGFILPNDRVDVILTRRDRNGKKEQHVSDTLFSNVRVLAIGQAIEIKNGEKTANGKTATLELTPRQAESLALARSIGEISLVLRSLTDSRQSGKGIGANVINERSNSIKTLRYGDKAQAFGVK